MKSRDANALRVINGGAAAVRPTQLPPAVPRFLTVAEVADALHLRPRTIYNMVSQGRIPFRKAGGKLLFEAREIEAWTKARADNQ